MPSTVGLVASHYTPKAFTPADLPNLVGWWDAADAATFTYSSGQEISGWADKSGAGRHFTQAVIAQQPSRTGVQNGQPCIAFNSGVQDTLASSVSVTQPFTFFMSSVSYGAGAYLYWWMDGAGGSLFVDSGVGYYLNNVNVGNLNPGMLDAPVLLTVRVSGGAWYIWRNETLVVGGANAGGAIGNPLYFGFRAGDSRPYASFQSNLFEPMIYNRALPDAECVQVRTYLRAKWGTP